MQQATEKQLSYLKRLGYTGAAPSTLREASDLIELMQDGATSEAAERGVLVDRAPHLLKARLRIAEVESRRRNGEQIAGWRLKVRQGAKTEANAFYHRAFLPLPVGKQFPEILTISGLEHDTLQRPPAKGSVVVTLGEVAEIEPKQTVPKVQRDAPVPQAQRKGCFGAVALVTLTAAAASVLVASWTRAL